MEITGKLIQLLPDVQGESARGPWVRGGFVIETGDDYPRKVAFTAFGEERVAMAKNIPAGTLVQVTFTPESREFNERWYTDLRASRIQPMTPGQIPPVATSYSWAAAPTQVATAQPPVAAPAPAPTPAAAPFAQAPTMPQNESEDLPF